jgi:cobyrinic acid a,c-diamide synthase
MLNIPRILIAGTHSGAGKTSVALGLVRALTRRGLKVQPFKVGPDFLDPTYLALAASRECHNLDGWMMGEGYVQSLFTSACARADIAVIEGVMGMYDGIAPGSLEGSSAQVAQLTQSPVILVADAGGMAGSIAALVRGYAGFGSGASVAGVIANKIGSADHAALLKSALEIAATPPLLGGIVRGALPGLKRRHLGLVSATGKDGETLDMLADAVEKALDMEAILALARRAPALEAPSGSSSEVGKTRARLGVAWDGAFHFYYPDNLAALERCGLELVRFSPIADTRLPEGLDGLYFGGGYPEEFAGEISENRTMLEDTRRFIASGAPVYAECGGLIYLSQGVEDREGKRWPMVGRLSSWTRMLGRFRALGYVEARLTQRSLFGEAGARMRGHRFHYSELIGDPAAAPEWSAAYELTRPRTGEKSAEGYQSGGTLASYAHIHFASAPGRAENFTQRILEARAI